ncbi:capsular polysaccharide biosynthesis protein [Halovulum dunhuangense]|uniref:Capsular polysaccharide biosynthesis protein n=1 Tax=Halovulum dunhuangense TaxID=1505036 RepID=A0A849L561_9RHOB|nr:capsular polysaccharide biosynthesis protein [Halovulum dunhuangense]NNU81515.1 capsular polysaccharide biosynthesis protein [Halovulum dunhuangense]
MASRRRLAVYSGGFLFDRRIRRILHLAGWDIVPGLRPSRADAVGVWGRRPVARRGLWAARRFGLPLLNVEDAFLRSVRPGPSGDRPLGLLLDGAAMHYDAGQPSDLETLLATADLERADLLDRARDGIDFLRRHGISKYSDWDPDAQAPDPGYVLVIDQTRGDAAISHAGASAADFAAMLDAARSAYPGARIVLRTHPVTASGHRRGHFGPQDCDARTTICADPVNPWALLEGAIAVHAVSSQLGFEAILAGHRPVLFGQPFYAGWGLSDDRKPVARRGKSLSREALFGGAMLEYPVWYDPHRDRLTDFETVAQALAAQARAWRENRRSFVCTGMKPWKHKPVSDFLAGAGGRPRFENDPARAVALAARAGRDLLIWAGRETPELRAAAEASGVRHWRVEDGFLRSVGLGAQLLPAASLVLDDLGIYFDPNRESRLERLIAKAATGLSAPERRRALALAEAIVAARITKYNVGRGAPIPAAPGRRVVLVPGQVEDDASIRTGTTDVATNLELLRRARAHFPDACIVFKPHPDVEIGLRKGAVAEADLARLADHVARDASAAEAMAQADVIWTMTSLMGFEALLRGREVHCLGMPFYAGWGLTEDHGQTHPRRSARPDLAALVHAALIAYPRYFDAETGLACAPEVILERLSAGQGAVSRQATRRHRIVAALQYRLRGLAPLWRR